MATKNVFQPRRFSPEAPHYHLLQEFYQGWIQLERGGCPTVALRLYISSLRLAVATVTTVEKELAELLELAEARLRHIEQEDASLLVFDRFIGRR